MSEAGAIKGRYEKRQVLGEGGMGVVYRAYDADLKREVALKTLRDGGDELALEMFRKECGVLASLNHPNIVDIYDVGQFEEGGVEKPYFVMPLLPGTTLDRIIKNEPQRLTVERTVEIIAQTCRGLHAAHERGLIHRDLKPSNIFVLADDSVKIIDFGIAHLTGTHTSVGLKGTLYYMAPEQMELKPASPQSDIYSLGVVCYEILAQRRPFLGANRDEVMRAIMRGSAVPVSELNPLVSQGLSQVIHAALAKRPQSRYTTSREFADCLQKALRNQPIDRFSPDKVEPRLQRVEKALAGEEFEFANEVLTGLEEEGQIHPAIHTLRGRLDHTLRERTIAQLMESARRRFSENEYQLALQKVQEVLQLDPRHAAALGLRADIESRRSAEQIDGWVRLARQHLDGQKFSLAREALGNALAINPQDTQANSLRGEIERLERTVGESRAKKRELYQQAQEAWQRGDVTAALAKIEKVVEADRQTPEPGAVELTNTYLNFYNRVRVEHDSLVAGYEEAKRHVANGNLQAAGEICDRFLAKHPNHALFQALRFDVGERLHQTVAADMERVDREVEAEPDLDRRVKILEAAVARHPGEAHFREALKGVASKRDLVGSIAQKARSFEESGQFQEAISQWDILRNIYPQFPGLDAEVERLKKRRQERSREDARSRWAERIEAAINAGDYSRAIELTGSAVAEFPGDAGLAGLEKQARQRAEQSKEADGLLAKGRELKASGKLVEAAAALKKASELDPRNPATRAALVDVMVAHAAGQVEKDWNNADGWLDQALAIDANHSQARSLKAVVGDKRREAAIQETLARVRELQNAGNLRGAYQEVLSGLAAYPLENRLTQLKTQLSRAIEDAEKAAAAPTPPKAAPPQPAAPAKQSARKEKAAAPPPPPLPPPAPKQPAAASVPPPPSPPPPAATTATPGKKPPIWAAALAVPLLAIAGWIFLKPGPPPPPPPSESALVALQLTVDPPTARVRAGGKDFGVNRNIELPEGDHELEIYGDGIKPLRVPVKVTKGMSAPPAIQAELETPALVLALSGARATLDGKLLTAGGSLPVTPGDHKLEIYQGAVGRGTVDFTIVAGGLPVVKSVMARGLPLTVAAVLGSRGRVFGPLKGALGTAGDLADIPAAGLELNGLTTQPQPFRLTDGTEPRAYDLTAMPAPTLAVFVADPGRVDLTISSNEEGASVQINGRPSGPIAKGQHLAQLMPGTYKVKVSKPGFTEVERAVTLAKGRPAREQFDLKAVLASVKVVGATGRAQVFIDGKPAGEMGPGDALVVTAEPGRHRLSVKSEHHQATDRDYEFRSGAETVVAFKELAFPVGYVQLSAPPGYSVSYAIGNDRPQAAPSPKFPLAVGDYVFRATAPGGGAALEPKTAAVRLGQTVDVIFAAPRSAPAPSTTADPRSTSSTTQPAPSLSQGRDWKEDDGWQKLDSGRQAAVPGTPAGLSFQVRRKGAFLGLGGKPGWHYIVGADFVRFELSGDKLTWWVTNSKERDRKRGEVPVPKDAEDVRIEITPSVLKVLVGGQGRDVTAADAGMASFAGGQFKFRGPISIKGLSVRAR